MFLIKSFRVDRQDAKCPTNVILGNDFGSRALCIPPIYTENFDQKHFLLNKFTYFRNIFRFKYMGRNIFTNYQTNAMIIVKLKAYKQYIIYAQYKSTVCAMW